ncbi:MAG: tetratricopeptide repeat protein [Spirochaetes bacterium]|nr:tetratricopeptide repeat protein [Spirochaetota bacterium]
MILLLLIILNIATVGSQSIDLELAKQADDHFEKHNYYNASKIYEKLKGSPDIKKQDRLLYRLGVCYDSLQKQEKAFAVLQELLSDYPSSEYIETSLPLMVKYLGARRKYSEAIALLEKYINQYPGDQLKQKLLEMYEGNKEYDKALKYLEDNFSLSRYYVEKKYLYLTYLKKNEEAIRFLNEAFDKFNDPYYYKMIADLYVDNGDFDTAERFYDKAYDQSKDIQYIIDSGRMYAIHNKTEKAKQVWGRLFQIIGKKQFTYQHVAGLYKEYGFYNDLLDLYEKAKKDNFDFTQDKIDVLQMLGKYKVAVNEYLKVMNRTNFSVIKKNILDIAMVEGQHQDVESVLMENISDSPRQAAPLLKILYYLYYERSQMDKAENILLSYVARQDVETNFIDDVIQQFINRNQYNRIFRVIKNMDKKMIQGKIQFQYATVLYHLGQYDRALDELDRLNRKDVKKEDIDFLMARIYMGKGDYRSSVTLLKNYGKDIVRYLNLIDSLLFLGKPEESLDYINKEKGNKNFPRDILLFKEGIYFIFLNRTGEAKASFNKLLEIYPNSDYANESVFLLYIWDNEFIKNNEKRKETFYKFIKNYYKKDYQKAGEDLNDLNLKGTTLAEVVQYWQSRCFYLAGEDDKALDILKLLSKEESIVLPYVLELAGDIYYFKKGDKKQALLFYKKLIDQYPQHPEIQQIRNRILDAQL